MGAIDRGIRLIGSVSPRLGARFSWQRQGRGDFSHRLVDDLVHRGDFIVDAGANWGLYTGRFAELTGRDGRVYAFEPDPLALAKLRAIGGERRTVRIFPVGLSDRASVATLHIPVHQGRRLSALASVAAPRARSAGEYEAVSIKLARLDDLLPAGERAVSFFKCDVEGHELAVLRGAEATLRRGQPTILIEIEQRHQQEQDIRETIDYILAFGYAGYAVYPDGLRPVEQFDLQRDQLAHVGDHFEPYGMPHGYVHDFLFVRPGVDISGLLASRGSRSGSRRVLLGHVACCSCSPCGAAATSSAVTTRSSRASV